LLLDAEPDVGVPVVVGVNVLVGGEVDVLVGIFANTVGVFVEVTLGSAIVGAAVGVWVAVWLGVSVGVAVGVLVGTNTAGVTVGELVAVALGVSVA
jgi:hypothetical protein